MGRHRVDVDLEAALDLIERGEKVPAVAAELGVSAPTLRNRIADLSKKQGLLLQYRQVQSLQLTELQARVLEAITPDKIEEASLKDLIASYKILKDRELVLEGKPTEIKGLVEHLIYIEKQEKLVKDGGNLMDVEFETDEDFEFPEDPVPAKSFTEELAELDDSDF